MDDKTPLEAGQEPDQAACGAPNTGRTLTISPALRFLVRSWSGAGQLDQMGESFLDA